MTTKGIEFDPLLGRIRIVNGTRVVATTEGTLICLLGDLVQINDVTVEFPDGQYKDHAYVFIYNQTRVADIGVDHYRQTNQCQTIFTRRPEEFLQSQDLMDAPPGADLFVGHVKLTRTTSPSHPWGNDNLLVLPKQGEWIPLTGSFDMEQGLGLTRLMHIVPEAGKLRLKRQMSIGPYMGGYGTQGSFGSPTSNTSGREVVFETERGIPVWTSTASPYAKSSVRDTDTVFPSTPGLYLPLRKGAGASACSIVDPTNYRSVYSVSVRGYFGRRS